MTSRSHSNTLSHLQSARSVSGVQITSVALITSSFADEVFGKLFAQLGPMTFMNRVMITGGSKVVRQLIDRAIMQRLAQGKP